MKVSARPTLLATALKSYFWMPLVDTDASASVKITIEEFFTGYGATATGKAILKVADEATLRNDIFTYGTTATGDMFYRSGSNINRLPIGANGKALTVIGGVPGWSDPSMLGPGAGTVVNTIPRWSVTTGAAIKGSLVSITDNGTINGIASAAGYASINIPHGVAPSAPANGDVWTTTAGMYVRVNGATVGPLAVASGGLTNFTEAVSIAAPNATIPAVSFTATNAATNVDIVLRPKGTGSILAQVPDNALTGGNKRGINSVDLQTSRTSNADRVAGGTYCVIGGGQNNKITAAVNTSTIAGGSANWINDGLSFIGGGSNNTTTGAWCVIGGGASNTSSGTASTCSGGEGNSSGGTYSSIGGGRNNTTSGTGYAAIPGGYGNNASGYAAVISGGQDNVASGNWSTVLGGRDATTRGIYGQRSAASGLLATKGDCQTSDFDLRIATAGATPTTLTTDANAPSTNNQIILPNNHSFGFRGMVVARTSAGDVKMWDVRGCITRGANAAATSLVGVVTLLDQYTAGAMSLGITFTADTTNGGLKIEATGIAATSIRWHASIKTCELGF